MTTKLCQFCDSPDNLYQDIKGRVHNVCIKCRPLFLKNKAAKAKQTMLKRYGVTNPSFIEGIEEKKKQTNLKNRGVEYPTQSQDVKDKIDKVVFDKHGVHNVSQIPTVKEIKKNKSIKAGGTICTLQGAETLAKIKQTMNDRYNCEYSHQNPESRAKYETTMVERHGVIIPSKKQEFKDKAEATNLKRRGVTHPAKDPLVMEKCKRSFKKNNWDNFNQKMFLKKIKPLFNVDYYIDHNNKVFNYECLRCGKQLEFESTNPIRISCICYKQRSLYEDEIIEWLKTFYTKEIISNKRFYETNRIWFEIDIYLPEDNIGIDFHGIYWHSDIYKDRNYHQNKYLFFKDRSIQLLQVFESDWVNKNSIIKSIISSKLGIIENKYHARKCVIKEVQNTKIVKEFLVDNHLQGWCASKVNIGLFHKEELIALATFGKNRFKKAEGYELLRYANKCNIVINGGFSRLLTYFNRVYQENLISFVDVRLFTGSSYIKNGFILDSLTKPNYYYFKQNSLELENRINYQKHKLSKKLESFDASVSEYTNMLNNKYYRIFDAGNLKMVFNEKEVILK